MTRHGGQKSDREGRFFDDRLKGTIAGKAKARKARLKGEAVFELPPGTIPNHIISDLEHQRWPIDRLLPASRLVRRKVERQVTVVARCILQYGFCAPILVTGAGEIIDGHTRVEAMKRLRQTVVPVIVVDHLEPELVRRLRIDLNRTQETGAWDFELLGEEIHELEADGHDAGIISFDTPLRDALFAAQIGGGEEDDEDAVDEKAPIVSRIGDLWRLGGHRLYCGSATEAVSYQRLMDDWTARVMITDPPWNLKVKGIISSTGHREFVQASGEMSEAEFLAFLTAFFTHSADYLVEGGLAYSFIDWRQLLTLTIAAEVAGLSQIGLIVWAKTTGGMGGVYRSRHELIPLFRKGGTPHLDNVQLGKHGRSRDNVWEYAGAASLGSEARAALEGHPTPKPVSMIADAIRDVTGLGEVVLDPFLGSGTTIMAAEATGRRCFGMELDPIYCDLILRRWQKKTGEKVVHAGSGLSFEEIAAGRSEAPRLLALPAPEARP